MNASDSPEEAATSQADAGSALPAEVTIRLSPDATKAYISVNARNGAAAGDISPSHIEVQWIEAGLDRRFLRSEVPRSLAGEWNRTHAPIVEYLAAEAEHPASAGADATIE